MFANKFIKKPDPTIEGVRDFESKVIKAQFQKLKQTDTTKFDTRQGTEELDVEQMDENVEACKIGESRALVCKTMATIKSRSTFIEIGGAKASPGRVNISTLVFGNDSLTKPTCKGSSVGQGMPSNNEIGQNLSISIRKC